MQLMADELCNRGFDATTASYSNEWYGYKNDINLNLELETNRMRLHYKMMKFAIYAIARYDIFHFHYGSSLYGNRLFPHIDMMIIKKLGKKVYMHFRGSDLIDKKYYDKLENINEDTLNLYSEDAIRHSTKNRLPIISKYSDKIFVSTPNMLELIPNAILIPQIISNKPIDNYSRRINMDKSIKIVHAPTDKKIKGTKIIVDIINGLIQEGYNISLELIENKKPIDVLESFNNCDLGIDQLFSGWYGKVSIELMQLGKPVFCFLHNEYKNAVPFDIPIININKKTIKEKLKYYLENIKELQAIGKKGTVFVNEFHSQNSVIDRLIPYYICNDE